MTVKTEITPPASVAVIGLGNMGSPMAACLMRAGYRVIGFDLSEAARKVFSATGGHVAATVDDAIGSVDVVITLLPDGKAVRAVLEPLRQALKPGCIIVDMSSSDPLGTRALGQSFVDAGLEFVDAPVSGGVKRAIDGSLAIMAGGDPVTIDRIQPLLVCMGRSIFRTGQLGSGHAMKALNNYVSAAGLIAAVEATQIGEKFGLDPELMADIFNASTGRNNTTEVKLKQFIISKAFNAGFPLRLMAKDVRTADSLAHAIGVPVPLADTCAQLWDDASKALGEKADHTEIGKYIERLKSPS
jgi:3-hydroxyisobutyrate dehydrogenase